MEQREQPLERGEGRRTHLRLAQARLDRLAVPVAEVVERQVVETVDRVREVECAEVDVDLFPRPVEPGEDPALLDGRRERRPLPRPGAEQEAARVPELVRELASFLDRADRKA